MNGVGYTYIVLVVYEKMMEKHCRFLLIKDL